ncbi:MAG: hypothetical protein AAGD86_00265 [Pseudomonadota bacterium]
MVARGACHAGQCEPMLELKRLLRSRAVNGWPLFWLLSAPLSVVMVIETLGSDVGNATDVSHLISYSVRWAVPFIYVVLASSALNTLAPGAVPAWLLRNRKQLGLCFAVAMAWQGLFIYLMSTAHRDHYFDEIYYLRDELEGSTGYVFLTALVVTSFRHGRKALDARQWKRLHTVGVYFLWAYPFSVYWWALFYYPNPEPIDYVFYAGGFVAFALRIAAWGKKRTLAARRQATAPTPAGYRALGAALIAAGAGAAVTGLSWQNAVSTVLTTPAWSANFELWVPYWPFEPFLPLALVGLGTALTTMPGAPAASRVSAEPHAR